MAKKYEIIYGLIKEDVKWRLNQGMLSLPGERELAADYGVSRQTIRQALLMLEHELIIERVQGSGIYLTGKMPDASSNTIAIILQDEQEYVAPSFIAQAEHIAGANGFSIDVYSTYGQDMAERSILMKLCEQIPRGIIAMPLRGYGATANYDLFTRLSKAGCSILFLHNTYTNLPFMPAVNEDNYNAGYSAGEFLISEGHKKIGCIFRADDFRGQERYLGLCRAVIDHGSKLRPKNVMWFLHHQLYNLEKFNDTSFLSLYINNFLTDCSSIVCQDDEIAYHLIRELSYSGIKVPEDVSVIGFDNSYMATLSQINITSMGTKEDLADAAVSQLLLLIKKQRADISALPYSLFRRSSTAALNS